MNGVGGGEGDFSGVGVEDVFLAGFEAWSELGAGGQMPTSQSAGSSPGSAGAAGGAAAPPGIGSMTGLGGSMQSFLGEAGLLQEGGSGAESNKSSNSSRRSRRSGRSSSGADSRARGVASSSSAAGGKRCKAEPLEEEEEEEDDDDEDDDGDGDSEDDEIEYHQYEQDTKSIETSRRRASGGGRRNKRLQQQPHNQQQQQQQQQQGGVRGLGRIFGMGTHPIAEAQARAEAMVHGRGGVRGGGNGTSAAEAAEKKRKRAVLSKEERAKQNRDRNREHARNTRLRKKAFVEELKKQVEELVAGREREEAERRSEARRVASIREIRLQVLLTFLEYRGRCEMGRKEWQSVLDENFEMRMPVTPYRSFPPQQVQGGMRVIKGLDGVIADTISLTVATKAASPSGRQARLEEPLPSLAAPSSSCSGGRKGKAKANAKASRTKRNSSSDNSATTTATAAVGASSSSNGGVTSSGSCSGTEGDDSAAAAVAAASAAAAAAASVAGVVPSPNRVYYVVDPKEVMGLNQAFMCPFLARSPQLLVPGMLKAWFSPKSNRLCSVQMSFDPTVPARQLARAAMLQGRATPGMTGMMAGMLGMGGVDVPSLMGGKGGALNAARGRAAASTEANAAFPPSNPSNPAACDIAGEDEAVLQSVLQDIREWRVSSTVVDAPNQGKSYLRVYPLSGDTPGVTHFIGVLESLASAQAAQGQKAAGAAASTETPSSSPSSGVQTGGGDNSSGLEAGASEGETSSDSASSTAKGHVTFHEGSSGSGGSDDGTGARNHSGERSRRQPSSGTTSDGGFSSSSHSHSVGSGSGPGPGSPSGRETRRSSRRGGSGSGRSSSSGNGGAVAAAIPAGGRVHKRGRA